METEIRKLLEELRVQGRFLLNAPRKLETVIDCIATTPELQGKCYTKKKIQDAYVYIGMIDKETKTARNPYQMMARC